MSHNSKNSQKDKNILSSDQLSEALEQLSPLEQLTESPPEELTEALEQLTEPLEQLTESPEQSTESPDQSTEPREQLTEPPEQSTESPDQESEALPQKQEAAGQNTKENEENVSKEKLSLKTFQSEIHQIPEGDARLQAAIDFMTRFLSQGGVPHFKTFWEVHSLTLELFKQNISPFSKNTLWVKCADLAREARRLQDMFEEQSAFAAEQIEIAIHSLEAEVAKNGEPANEIPENFIPIYSKTLMPKQSFYKQVQYALNSLNAQAARINALRKELIKTGMRIRIKNNFFERLSTLGDKVFPLRKEQIQTISEQFIEDVNAFVNENFSEDKPWESLFFLREEIKALQAIAKELTLNTSAFTTTRLKLSECWDKLKVEEKERKRERSQQKAIFKQNFEEIQKKIVLFKQSFMEGQFANLSEANQVIESFSTLMRERELDREYLNILREELGSARALLKDRTVQEEKNKFSREQELEQEKKQHHSRCLAEIDGLILDADSMSVETLLEKREAILKKNSATSFTKIEKQQLEKKLNSLRDLLADKKEKTLMALSEDDRQALQQLKDLLKEKKERRLEIKTQLEAFRKAKGNSGMDFEQAMAYHAQIEEEKARLEKINISIQEVEGKVKVLQRAPERRL
jgi:hypothetical protein